MPKKPSVAATIPEPDTGLNSDHLYRMLRTARSADAALSASHNLFRVPEFPLRSYQMSSGALNLGLEDRPPTWMPPAPTNATRGFASISTVSVRGATKNTEHNRELIFDSLLERDFLDISQADRRVREIQEQPPRQRFWDADGNERHHTFDCLLTMVSGEKVAVALKPEALRKSSGVDHVVAWFQAQGPADFADKYVVRSRNEVTRSAAYNARLILWARRLRDDDDVECLARLFRHIHGTVILSDVLSTFGDIQRGFTAAVQLLDEGRLSAVEAGRIDHDSRVFVPANLQ